MKVDVSSRTVELTRTNLLSLLAKLDGHPPNSACTITKAIAGSCVWAVKAVEDDEHYGDRPRGLMVAETEAALAQ